MDPQRDNPGVPFSEFGKVPEVDNPPVEPTLIHGKYKSLEAADEGYSELLSTLSSRSQENDILKSKISAYEQVLLEQQQLQQPMQENPLQKLVESGIDPDVLLSVIGQAVKAELAPVQAGIQAQSQFEFEHPEYRNVQPEVAQFVGNDPRMVGRFNKMYQTDPYGAMEWAYDRYREVKQKTPAKSAADNPSKAALPNQSATAKNTVVDSADFKQRQDKALDYFNKYGDMTAYLDTLIEGGIKPMR